MPRCPERWELLTKATRQPQSAGEGGALLFKGNNLLKNKLKNLSRETAPAVLIFKGWLSICFAAVMPMLIAPRQKNGRGFILLTAVGKWSL